VASLNLGSLFFTLGAKTSGLEAATKKASAFADKTQASANRAAGAFDSLKTAIKGAIAVESIRRGLLLADSYLILQQRIKTATGAVGDYNKVSQELFRISNKTGSSLAGNVSLFQSLARVAPSLNATRAETLALTEIMGQLGVIGGSSVEQMSNGLMQFSQGMASGVLRAEEMNSLLENIPEVANRIAKGLGMSAGELRKAVNEGTVLSEQVFYSLLSQSADISREFDALGPSIGRSVVALKNSATKIIGEFSAITGTVDTIAAGISTVATGLAGIDVAALADGLKRVAYWVESSGLGVSIMLAYRAAIFAANSAAVLFSKTLLISKAVLVSLGVILKESLMGIGIDISGLADGLKRVSYWAGSLGVGLSIMLAYRAAIFAANSAAVLFSKTLLIVKANLMSLGIGVLIVAIGELVYQFMYGTGVIYEFGQSLKGYLSGALEIAVAGIGKLAAAVRKVMGLLGVDMTVPIEVVDKTRRVASQADKTPTAQKRPPEMAYKKDTIEQVALRKLALAGDDASKDAAAVTTDKLQSKLSALGDSLMTELEYESKYYNESLELLQNAEELKLNTVIPYYELRERLEQEHQQRMDDLLSQHTEARRRIDAVGAFMGVDLTRSANDLTLREQAQGFKEQINLAAQHNQSFFGLQKALAMATAAIEAPKAVLSAYRFGAATGGPALGSIFAGIAAAATAVQVSAIASSQYQGGRAEGGGVYAGGMYRVNERGPELLSVGNRDYLMMGSQNGSVTPNSKLGGGTGVVVNVYPQSGETASVRSRETANGIEIDVVIEKMEQQLADGITQGGTLLSNSIEQQYGLNRVAGAYS
jgi:tape measure domain-containing protein